MLDIIKILFFVVGGIFLVSILNENPVSLVTPYSYNEVSSLEAPPRDIYLRSYDINGDGIVSDEEYRVGELGRITEELEVLTRNLDEALLEANRSPYAEYITLRNGNLRTEDEDEEYISIHASTRFVSPVRITGWKLKSLVSDRVRSIPRGSSNLASTRAWQSTSDIFLAPGEEAIVVSGNAAGIRSSFLTNVCTGYLEEEHHFTPALFAQCPRLIDEDLAEFNISPRDFSDIDDYDECVEAIENVQSCREGDTPNGLPTRCRNFIRDYSDYSGCYKLHRYDSDFLGNEWRIFLGATSDLWRPEREAVALIDENGKVVDVIEN